MQFVFSRKFHLVPFLSIPVFFIFSCSISLSPICHLIQRCTLRWGYTCAFLRGRPHALVALYRVSPAQNFSKYNAVKIQRQATLTKSWIMQRRVSRRGWKGGGEESRAKEKWVTDSNGGKVPPLSSGVFPRCIFPRVLFLSSRPLRRSFFPLFLPLLVRRFSSVLSQPTSLDATDRVVRAFHSFLATPGSSPFTASRGIKRRDRKGEGEKGWM